jgi:hypothetical protein
MRCHLPPPYYFPDPEGPGYPAFSEPAFPSHSPEIKSCGHLSTRLPASSLVPRTQALLLRKKEVNIQG